jgi:7-alpha-hydroxysteroid dehydrogenase
MTDHQPLLGKIALVTGASRGIGKGIALDFADAGADVVVTARTMSDLEQTASEVEARGRQALAVHMDAYDYESVEASIDAAVERFGGLDILVNNAGGSRNVEGGWLGFMDVDVKSVDEVFRLHVSSPYVAAKKAAKVMIDQGRGGSIINISSALGFYPSQRVQNYSAAKAALNELTKLWAVDLGPYGIRVNAIGPGVTHSATTDKLFATRRRRRRPP